MSQSTTNSAILIALISLASLLVLWFLWKQYMNYLSHREYDDRMAYYVYSPSHPIDIQTERELTHDHEYHSHEDDILIAGDSNDSSYEYSYKF